MAIVQGEIWTGLSLQIDTNLDQYMPFNCAWQDSRLDYIIRASELTAIGLAASYQITEIRIRIEGVPALSSQPNIRVAMKHTAKATQPAGTYAANSDQYSTFTEVYFAATQSFTTASSWISFTLLTPFTWDGASNLMVSLSKDGTTASTNTGSTQYRVHGGGNERTKAYRSNSAAAFPYDSGTEWRDDFAPRTYIVANDAVPSGTTYTQIVGSATLTPSSTMAKRTSKRTGSATIAPAGSTSLSLALAKIVGGGTITPTGSLAQSLAGLAIAAGGAILTPIGSLAKRTYKGVGGVITPIGNAAKGLFKTVGGGSVIPSGTVISQLNPEPPPTMLKTAINWVMKGLKNFFD